MLLPQQEADQALEVLSQSVKHQVLQFPEDQEIEEKTLCTVLSAMADAVSGLVGLMYIHRGLQDEAFLRGADKRGKISENSVAQRKKQGEENGSREAQALQERNWFYAAFDFPQTYVERMQEILYPTAYVTCFSRNNNNSAMWGNYADCHRGICIEYRIDEDNKIPLTDCSYKALEAEPVQYGEGELECNFFTSLGRLTYSQIKTWLTGKHDTSTLMQTYTAEDQYTDKYWEIAKLKTLHKTSEWAYEQEYRISVIDSLDMLREPGRRNVSYDPKVLTGIIFGIKTSEYDKMQILRAVINHGRYGDVTFYQAEYDDQTRKIVIRKRGWAKLLSDHRPQ